MQSPKRELFLFMPLTISYGNNTENGFVLKDRIKYKYDEMGNICEAYENGQLVAEYNFVKEATGEVFEYVL